MNITVAIEAEEIGMATEEDKTIIEVAEALIEVEVIEMDITRISNNKNKKLSGQLQKMRSR
jgi:hypothetical protein